MILVKSKHNVVSGLERTVNIRPQTYWFVPHKCPLSIKGAVWAGNPKAFRTKCVKIVLAWLHFRCRCNILFHLLVYFALQSCSCCLIGAVSVCVGGRFPQNMMAFHFNEKWKRGLARCARLAALSLNATERNCVLLMDYLSFASHSPSFIIASFIEAVWLLLMNRIPGFSPLYPPICRFHPQPDSKNIPTYVLCSCSGSGH